MLDTSLAKHMKIPAIPPKTNVIAVKYKVNLVANISLSLFKFFWMFFEIMPSWACN